MTLPARSAWSPNWPRQAADRRAAMSQTKPDDAGSLFREGRLTDAVAAANAAVRKAPSDLGARLLLAELLVFSGNLERADVILDACGDLGPVGCRGDRRVPPIGAGRGCAATGVPGWQSARIRRRSDGRSTRCTGGDPGVEIRQSCGSRAARGTVGGGAGFTQPGSVPPVRSTIYVMATTFWPAASRLSPRRANISGSRPSG